MSDWTPLDEWERDLQRSISEDGIALDRLGFLVDRLKYGDKSQE